MDTYYPTLDIQTVRNLKIIQQLARETPGYWEGSPYPTEVEAFVGGVRVAAPPTNEGDSDKNFDIIKETRDTLTELKKFKPEEKDTAQLMAYYRTKTALIDKILAQMDKGTNQKQISEFYSLVLSTLEEICSATQIATFNERLKDYNE